MDSLLLPHHHPPTLDIENFLAIMESCVNSGDTEFVEANMDRLQATIDQLQRRVFDLSRLQYRACVIRDEYNTGGKKAADIPIE